MMTADLPGFALPSVSLPGLPFPMSRTVLGTMTFGDSVSEADASTFVDMALDAGVNSIDTANGYAQTQSETIVGAAVAGRRDQVILATKAGMYDGDADGAPLLSERGLRRSLEGSLRRLSTDVVDVFYLHQPDRSVTLTETIDTVAGLMDQGLIRSYGVSNYASWQIADIFRLADERTIPRPILSQQMYSLVGRDIESEFAEFAITKGLTTIVYNPLGGGLLSGKYHVGSNPESGRFGSSLLTPMYRDRYFNDVLLRAATDLKDLAERHGMTLPELSLRWLLARPVVSAVLVGASRAEHLAANLAALAAGPLTEEVVAACDDICRGIASPMPQYNR